MKTGYIMETITQLCRGYNRILCQEDGSRYGEDVLKLSSKYDIFLYET